MPAPHPDANLLGLRHQRVQRLRRLLGRRSAREAERAFVVEGAKVLGEALDAGVSVESVYLAAGKDDATARRAFDAGARLFELAPDVLERVADTVTPQPVLAVVPYVDVLLRAVEPLDFLVVAVDVRDPGNAGTILRSAEAAGARGVVFCGDAVDVYNPKTVRASAGALFHVPVVVADDPVQVVGELSEAGVRCLATRAMGGVDYAGADLTGPTAFVLGNEANGIPPEVDAALPDAVTIPMAGRTESLNVGMAAAVLCFEAARQRRGVRQQAVATS